MRLHWLFSGLLLWSELADLLDHLPMESAYRTAIRDLYTDEQLAEISAAAEQSHGPWAKQELLLAQVINELRVLTSVQLAKAGVKAEPPVPVPVPGGKRASAKKATPQQVAYIADIRARHEAEKARVAAE